MRIVIELFWIQEEDQIVPALLLIFLSDHFPGTKVISYTDL